MALVKRADDSTKKDEIVDKAVADQTERVALIAGAIAELDPDEDFTKADGRSEGKPMTGSLQEVTGLKNITATERDQAFDIYNKG